MRENKWCIFARTASVVIITALAAALGNGPPIKHPILGSKLMGVTIKIVWSGQTPASTVCDLNLAVT
jgi:hypothetical protein